MPIKVLSDDVANKIAAGEVVERPASVVKELVENSLDADADEIRVELTEGGKRLIRVHDNGAGMSAEDATLCLRRHATSKLTSADDLAQIATLGFRGEAIPSIASVSRFDLSTRTPDALEGARVVVEGGKVVSKSPIGCPVGTRIAVADLFFNVPARLKFLKTEATELNHAVNHVQWAALAHPSTRFTLIHNGRELIDAPACETRLERIQLLYGKEFAGHLIAFTKTFETFEIECYVGDANLSKSNRAYQFFFLNDRVIRDRSIGAAVSRSMSEIVPKGRYPVVFLFMRLPASEVDVNVHPAKAEVRFRNERGIFRNVVQAMTQGVAESSYIPEVDTAETDDERKTAQELAFRGSPYRSEPSRSIIPPSRTQYGGIAGDEPRATPAERRPIPSRSEPIAPSERERTRLDRSPFDRDKRAAAADVQLLDLPNLELVGGIYNTYVLVADSQNLYIVDQHVASERVHYERIITRLQSNSVASQGLLAPITVELNAAQTSAFETHRRWLERFGLSVEAFGGRAIVVQAIPASLQPEQAKRMCLDLLDRVESDLDPERSWDEIQEKAAATIACHSAVRAGDHLTDEEMRVLLRDLSSCKLPFNCPHGRPILIRMPRAEIETRFHRR